MGIRVDGTSDLGSSRPEQAFALPFWAGFLVSTWWGESRAVCIVLVEEGWALDPTGCPPSPRRASQANQPRAPCSRLPGVPVAWVTAWVTPVQASSPSGIRGSASDRLWPLTTDPALSSARLHMYLSFPCVGGREWKHKLTLKWTRISGIPAMPPDPASLRHQTPSSLLECLGGSLGCMVSLQAGICPVEEERTEGGQPAPATVYRDTSPVPVLTQAPALPIWSA